MYFQQKINVIYMGPDLHVDDVVVSVVADLDVLEAELGEDLLPSLAVDEGGGVHRPAVRDNQNILEHNTPTMLSTRNGLLEWVKKRNFVKSRKARRGQCDGLSSSKLSSVLIDFGRGECKD